jgi:hypothetical protein
MALGIALHRIHCARPCFRPAPARSSIVAESWPEKAEGLALVIVCWWELVLHIQSSSSAVVSVFSPILLSVHNDY